VSRTHSQCGSCRAPARLRWRRPAQHPCCLTHRYRSLAGARQLPQGYAHASGIRSAVRPPRFACDFDLRRPVKPRWPSSDIDLGGKPAGRRFSRAGPWMAHRGGPPNQCRMTGTPSLGEVPSGGARAFCLLLRFSKVSRRQGGTLSGRYRSNGYVHRPRRELCRYPCRDDGRAASAIHPDASL